MRLSLQDDLPFIAVTLTYNGAPLTITNVLVDTGSASTLFDADRVAQVGLVPAPTDTLHTLRGIGGTEVVFVHQVDRLAVEEFGLDNFELEIGTVDYGFPINGILGMDFLTRTGAILDLEALTLEFTKT